MMEIDDYNNPYGYYVRTKEWEESIKKYLTDQIVKGASKNTQSKEKKNDKDLEIENEKVSEQNIRIINAMKKLIREYEKLEF
jgi:hypothetical protein